MSEATPLSLELSRGVSALSRAIVVAARCWTLYPPEHAAVRSSLDRLRAALHDTAQWLHQRDVAGLTFAAHVPPEELETLQIDPLSYM